MAQHIRQLLPQAQQTQAQLTQPTPANISRATKWLLGSGWHLVGTETPEEKAALENAFEQFVLWFASLLDGQPPRWLVCIGISGTGKTMLAKRICEYIDNWGRAVFTRTVGEQMRNDDTRRIYSYAQQGPVFVPWRTVLKEKGVTDRAAKDWFCCIDEIKSETGRRITIGEQEGVQPEPWEVRTLGNVFDDMLRKWRIVTMNLTRGQIATFWDVRIASRLMRDGNTIVDLSDVTDYGLRLEQKNKQQKP
jgi:hypothetical protein